MICFDIKKIKQCDKLLKNGVYKFNTTFDRVFLYNDRKINTFSETRQPWKKRILNSARKVIYHKGIKIEGKNKKFDGYEIIIPSSRYGFKIFSETMVMTVYFDNCLNKKNIDSKKIIDKIFPVPETIEFSNNYIIEKKVENYSYDKEQAIYFILSCTPFDIDINDKCFLSDTESGGLLIKNLFSKYDYLKSFPTSIQHCDMWSGNILYDREKFYIIDYEKVSKSYFLYDFFTYIYSEYYIYGDVSLLDKYFDGYYNDNLLDYFTRCGVNFDISKLKFYFITFLILFFFDRFSGLKKKSIMKEFNKLNSLFRRYGLE